MKNEALVDFRELAAEWGGYFEDKEIYREVEEVEVEPGPMAVRNSKSENKDALLEELNVVTASIPESIEKSIYTQEQEEKLDGFGKDSLKPGFFQANPAEIEDTDFWDNETTDFEIEDDEISQILDEIDQVRNLSDQILRKDGLGKREYDTFMHLGNPGEVQRLSFIYRDVSSSFIHDEKRYPEVVEEAVEDVTDDFDVAEEFRSYVHELARQATVIPLRDVPDQGTCLRENYVDVVGYGGQTGEKSVLEANEKMYVALDTADWLNDYETDSEGAVAELFRSGYLGLSGKETGESIRTSDAVILDYDGVMDVVGPDYADSQEVEVSGAAD